MVISSRTLAITFGMTLAFGMCSVGSAQSGTTTGGTNNTTGGSTPSAGTPATSSGSATTMTQSQDTGPQGTIFGTGRTASGAAGENTAQAFVGAASTEAFVGAGRQSLTNSTTNRQFRGITDGNTNMNRQTQQTGTPRTRPVALRIGFSFPAPNAAETSRVLSPANAPNLQQFVGVRPEFSEINVAISSTGIATLTGTTTSVDSRRLAANLIRFQPGVRGVENQILVPTELEYEPR